MTTTHSDTVAHINAEAARVIPLLRDSAKISDGKWSKRELNDIRSAMATAEMVSGLRASPGKVGAIAAQAVYGLYEDALRVSRNDETKRQAQYEALVKRIVDEGVPREIVESYR